MTRREFTNTAERQTAEAQALRDYATSGHYRQPAPPVDPAEFARIIEAAMRCLDPQAAEGQVARELRAAGAADQVVMRAMRRVGLAVSVEQATPGSVGNLDGSVRAEERRAAERLRRRRGPFDGGQLR